MPKKAKTNLPSPYEVLGVSKNASLKDIKKAFKEKKRKFHPDNRQTGDQAMFKMVVWAYETMTDPDFDGAGNHQPQPAMFNEMREQSRHHAKAEYQPNRDPRGFGGQQGSRFDNTSFNAMFDEDRKEQTYDRGYGDMMRDRLSKESDYEKGEKYKPKRLFRKGHFDLGAFNGAFNMMKKRKGVDARELVAEPEPSHIMNAGLQFTSVASHDGFMIIDTDQTEQGFNPGMASGKQSGMGYQDYMQAFDGAENPDKSISKTSKLYRKLAQTSTKVEAFKPGELQRRANERGSQSVSIPKTSFAEQERLLQQKKMQELEREQQRNQNIVNRFGMQFPGFQLPHQPGFNG